MVSSRDGIGAASASWSTSAHNSGQQHLKQWQEHVHRQLSEQAFERDKLLADVCPTLRERSKLEAARDTMLSDFLTQSERVGAMAAGMRRLSGVAPALSNPNPSQAMASKGDDHARMIEPLNGSALLRDTGRTQLGGSGQLSSQEFCPPTHIGPTSQQPHRQGHSSCEPVYYGHGQHGSVLAGTRPSSDARSSSSFKRRPRPRTRSSSPQRPSPAGIAADACRVGAQWSAANAADTEVGDDVDQSAMQGGGVDMGLKGGRSDSLGRTDDLYRLISVQEQEIEVLEGQVNTLQLELNDERSRVAACQRALDQYRKMVRLEEGLAPSAVQLAEEREAMRRQWMSNEKELMQLRVEVAALRRATKAVGHFDVEASSMGRAESRSRVEALQQEVMELTAALRHAEADSAIAARRTRETELSAEADQAVNKQVEAKILVVKAWAGLNDADLEAIAGGGGPDRPASLRSALEHHLREATSQLEAARRETHGLQERLMALHEQLTTGKARVGEAEARAAAAADEGNTRLQATFMEHEMEVGGLNRSLENERKAVSELRAKVQEMEKQRSEDEKTTRSEMAASRARMQSLETDLLLARTDASKMRAELAEKEAEVVNLNRHMEQQRTAAIEAQRRAVQVAREATKAVVKDLEKQLSLAWGQTKAALGEREKMSMEVQGLTAVLQEERRQASARFDDAAMRSKQELVACDEAAAARLAEESKRREKLEVDLVRVEMALEQATAAHKAESTRMEQQIEMLMRDVDSARKAASRSKQDLELVQQAREQDLQSLNARFPDAQARLQDEQRITNEAQHSISRLEEEVEAARRAESQAAQKLSVEVFELHESYEQALEEKAQELVSVRTELQRATDKEGQLQRALEQEGSRLREEADALRADLGRVQQSVEDAKAHHAEEMATVVAEASNLRIQIEVLTADCAAVRAERDELRRAKDALEGVLTSQGVAARDELRASTEALVSVRDEVDAERSGRLALQAEMEKQLQDTMDLRQRLDHEVGEREAAEGEVEGLRRQLEAAEDEAVRLQHALGSVHAELSEARQAESQLADAKADLASSLTERDDVIRQLHEKVDTSIKVSDGMGEQLHTLTQHLQALQSERDQLRAECEDLQRHLPSTPCSSSPSTPSLLRSPTCWPLSESLSPHSHVDAPVSSKLPHAADGPYQLRSLVSFNRSMLDTLHAETQALLDHVSETQCGTVPRLPDDLGKLLQLLAEYRHDVNHFDSAPHTDTTLGSTCHAHVSHARSDGDEGSTVLADGSHHSRQALESQCAHLRALLAEATAAIAHHQELAHELRRTNDALCGEAATLRKLLQAYKCELEKMAGSNREEFDLCSSGGSDERGGELGRQKEVDVMRERVRLYEEQIEQLHKILHRRQKQQEAMERMLKDAERRLHPLQPSKGVAVQTDEGLATDIYGVSRGVARDQLNERATSQIDVLPCKQDAAHSTSTLTYKPLSHHHWQGSSHASMDELLVSPDRKGSDGDRDLRHSDVDDVDAMSPQTGRVWATPERSLIRARPDDATFLSAEGDGVQTMGTPWIVYGSGVEDRIKAVMDGLEVTDEVREHLRQLVLNVLYTTVKDVDQEYKAWRIQMLQDALHELELAKDVFCKEQEGSASRLRMMLEVQARLLRWKYQRSTVGGAKKEQLGVQEAWQRLKQLTAAE